MADRRSWDEVATALQQELMETIGVSDWDSYQRGERNFLETKVGFALYGPPPNLPADNGENRTGYAQNQWENIKQICDLIIKEDVHKRENEFETWMAMIFVCIPIPDREGDRPNVETIPVFKVPKYTRGDVETVWYIDSHTRVYVNWKDYLDNNLLPACRYCYPKDGIYQCDSQDRVKVEFGETPASTASQTTLSVLDTTSNVVGLGSTILCLASLAIPVAGPLLAAATIAGTAVGVYGAGRSTAALVDRAQHGQSIAVTDQEARNCWLSIGGSAVGVAANAATHTVKGMSSVGKHVSTALRRTTNALNVTSLVINGAGVANNGFILTQKYEENTLTALDVFQFTASAFFLTHSVCNFKTARTIISETQTDVLQAYKESLRSNRHRKAFKRLAASTAHDMEGGVEVGKAKVIRAIRNIQNKDDFFAGVVKMGKDVRKTESNVKFTEAGKVQINHELTIDPAKLSGIRSGQRKTILTASKDLAAGTMSQNQFHTVVNPILQQNNSSTTSHQTEAISNIPNNVQSNTKERSNDDEESI